MRYLATILALAACRADDTANGDGDGRDLDSADPGCVATTEVAYDGIDQDCDGADLTDADGDGHDATVVGGDDCDDEDAAAWPGAEEVPYDGIDQDCDGADVDDVDGDGVSGADDCDDTDATSYPGGTEARGDGADNDCDGRTDEYVTCWDGSGDFETVQEGVDGTPDGGTLEICSGTYEELVTIEDRELVVEGDDPLGVLISASYMGGTSRPLSVQGDSDVTIRSLGLEGAGYCLRYLTDTTPMAVDEVDFSRCTSAFDTAGGGAGITIQRSYFGGGSANSNNLGGVATFRENIVDGTGGTFYLLGWPGSQVTISNNLFVSGIFGLIPSVSSDGHTEMRMVNNTFADLELTVVGVSVSAGLEPPKVAIVNNIFSEFRVVDHDESPLWYVSWEEVDASRYDVNPDASYNLFQYDGGVLAEVYGWNLRRWEYVLDEALSAEAEAALLNASILADPEFAAGPMGSYGLAPSSPAVDAGSGSPDIDGTPTDIGAFGGPDGDWYLEVPWPLP